MVVVLLVVVTVLLVVVLYTKYQLKMPTPYVPPSTPVCLSTSATKRMSTQNRSTYRAVAVLVFAPRDLT